VKEFWRILSGGKKLFHCYGLLRELDQAFGEEKLTAMDKLERYLENNKDRAYFDAWYAQGYNQMELGMTEKAVWTFKMSRNQPKDDRAIQRLGEYERAP